MLELYIHIPFCMKKCGYCDFLSMTADSETKLAYVHKLKEEIRYFGKSFHKRSVSSIFFGGGTPSVLHGQQIVDIMQTVRQAFQILPDAEISIECNPGTVSWEKLEAYRRAGINRISFGLQSTDEQELQQLGRIHTYEEFLFGYDLARKCGFQNINVDLMSALPGQTVKSWERTLKKVTQLKPEHISAYSLIIEEGTPFYEKYEADELLREKGEVPKFLPTEEMERQMYDLTEAFLKEKGYYRYEISNYAKPGKECRHNVGYWERMDYLGLGLGASSLIANCRYSNPADMDSYLHWTYDRLDPQSLTRQEQMEEYMFLGLRMMKGVSRETFQQQFGMHIESVYGQVLKNLEQQGLLRSYEGMVQLTEKGIDVSNYVLAEFLLDC